METWAIILIVVLSVLFMGAAIFGVVYWRKYRNADSNLKYAVTADQVGALSNDEIDKILNMPMPIVDNIGNNNNYTDNSYADTYNVSSIDNNDPLSLRLQEL